MKFKTGNMVHYKEEYLREMRLFPPPEELGVCGAVIRSDMVGEQEIVTVAFTPAKGRPYMSYVRACELQQEYLKEEKNAKTN